MKHPHGHQRGFSLIELLVTVGLLAIAGTIIIPMMNWGISTTGAAQRQEAVALRFDGATEQLRTDIWQATTVTVNTPQSVSMHQPDGTSVEWKIGPGDQLARNNQKWTHLGITARTTFVKDGQAVRLVIPPRPDGTEKSITFPAQTALLIRGAQ